MRPASNTCLLCRCTASRRRELVHVMSGSLSPIYTWTWESYFNCLLLRKNFEAVVRWCFSINGILLLSCVW